MIRGFLFVAFSIFIWGITFVNTKALLVDFSALEIQILRFGIAAISLFFVEKIFNKYKKFKTYKFNFHDELIFAGMGFFGVAAYQLLENCAIHYTMASNVSIIVSINPVVTALLAWMLVGEKRPSKKFFAGFFVAIVGVVLVSVNGMSAFHFSPVGDIMAFAAMLCWGGYSILVKKINESGLSQVWIMRRVFVWSLIMMIPFVIYGLTPTASTALSGSFSIILDATKNLNRFTKVLNLINLNFLGLLASAACFVLWNKACAILGVVRCTVGLYLIPAITVLFAFFCLGERLTLISSVGALLILLGVIISDNNLGV